jgi:LuxR family maltose regulon positive regulatory protein
MDGAIPPGGKAAAPPPVSALHLSPPTYAFTPVGTRALGALGTDLAQITLVAAPTGYGKTILLTELFRRESQAGSRCLWVGIDAHDGVGMSPIDALERHLGTADDNIPEALDYRRRPSPDERAEKILDAFSRLAAPVIIFIDNADLGDAADTRELLNRLIFDPRSTCKLVLSTSSEPPFDATRAVLELRMRSIGPEELGFDADQIEAVFRDAGLGALGPETTARVLLQSEGWPAAVRLIQILASTTGTPPAGESGLPWEGERLVDTLFDKLIARFPEELSRFVAETSIFSNFSRDLLAFATRSDRAGEFLQYLVDNRILIVSLDERGVWFRFHTLFKRYLARRRTTLADATRLREVMRRGAQWLERNERIESALDLAVEAGDSAMAVRLLEKLSWSLVRTRGYLPTFIHWADRVRELGCKLGDEAAFWLAWALIFERRYEEASVAVSGLWATLDGAGTARNEEQSRAKARLAEIVLKLHMDDLRSIQQLAPAWLENFAGDDPFEHGATAGALAIALLADHQFAAARSAARTSLAAVAPTTSLYGRVWASNISAAIAIASCNAEKVDEALAELKREICAQIEGESLIAAVTDAVRARAIYDRGDVAEATILAAKSLPLVRSCGMLDFLWQPFEVLIAATVIGHEGPHRLAELRQIAAEYPKRLSVLLDLMLARLYCNMGHVAQAQELGERLGIWSAAGVFSLPADFLLASERAAAHLTGIALMTVHGDLKGAEELIEAELVLARQSSRRGAVVELYLAQAAVRMKSGQQRHAVRAFSRALNLAAECKSVRPFYEQMPMVAHLMQASAIKELSLATEGARQIAERVGRLTAPAGSEVEESDQLTTVSDPLTKRELELLRMLDSGMDNAQISGATGISVRTVKWHLHNLYAKLDVKNRTSAIARARHMRLL